MNKTFVEEFSAAPGVISLSIPFLQRLDDMQADIEQLKTLATLHAVLSNQNFKRIDKNLIAIEKRLNE